MITTSTRGIAALAACIDDLRTHTTEPSDLARSVGAVLRLALLDPHLLTDSQRRPSLEGYAQHLLHVAPDRGFSIVSLVWLPGQATPIHDHVSWCVVGVYSGLETECRYRLWSERTGDQFLAEDGEHVAEPGQVTVLVPPDEDIHRVACGSTDVTVSIHVYGADIEALGTSIHRRFDRLPIREPRADSAPARWRS